jgi:hypothetical protein
MKTNDAQKATMTGTRRNIPMMLELYFTALPPLKAIEAAHVHQILGIGSHNADTVVELVQTLTARKKDACNWAGEQIKSKMAEVAQQMGVTVNGKSKFNEMNRQRTDSTYHIASLKIIKIGTPT